MYKVKKGKKYETQLNDEEKKLQTIFSNFADKNQLDFRILISHKCDFKLITPSYNNSMISYDKEQESLFINSLL